MSKQQAPLIAHSIHGPPGSRFLFALASQAQRAEVYEQLRALHRQTMNLRMMPTAQLITLVDLDRSQLVGFCGVDDEHDPRYPELFSLHLDERYRTFKLGLLLQTVRAQFLVARGHTTAYTRMDESSNAELLALRTSSEIFARLDPDTLDERYRGMCRSCELFEQSCLSQAFLKVDLKGLVQRGKERFSALDFTELPLLVELAESTFAKLSLPM